MRVAIAWAAGLALGSPDPAHAGCAVTDIALGAIVMGSLDAGDCTIADLGLDPADDTLVDVYRIVLATDGFVTVGLESGDFDALLLVLDEGLTTLLYADDDAGGGTDSLIQSRSEDPRLPAARRSFQRPRSDRRNSVSFG